MNNRKLKSKHSPALLCLLYFALCLSNVSAQSTSQNYPTAVTTNEISGKVPARDIGDARLTSYYYTFNGTQGDIFINVQTTNFNGDIDVFTSDTVRSLTKITIYADISQNETGRVVYLRKPEKLLLRIQGRTPNDDAATFLIKFAGSFEALAADSQPAAPELPEVKTETTGGIRVNSVGTIIETTPKPTPLPKETTAKANAKPKKIKADKSIGKNETNQKTANASDNDADGNKSESKTADSEMKTNSAADEKEKVISENVSEKEKTDSTVTQPDAPAKDEATFKVPSDKSEAKADDGTMNSEKTETKTTETAAETAPLKEPKKVKTPRTKTKKTAAPKPLEPNPLENIRLVILLKNGTKIEHQMSDVFRFNITDGNLTVITKDGKIERYSILDVEKTTIE